jgi:hypothetical protein
MSLRHILAHLLGLPPLLLLSLTLTTAGTNRKRINPYPPPNQQKIACQVVQGVEAFLECYAEPRI